MNDMRAVIIPKSDQLNSDDLLVGPITITITGVKITPGTEQPVSISYEGDNGKPYRACKSMCRVMVHCWGADANQYIGRSMTLYCDPKITWGGMAVGGIRISHMTDIQATQVMALTATKGSKKPFTVKPLALPESTSPPAPTIADWLRDVELELAATTKDEVNAILARADVQKVQDDHLRPKARDRLQYAIDEAVRRTSVASTADDDPPEMEGETEPFGDKPPDPLAGEVETLLKVLLKQNRNTMATFAARDDYRAFTNRLSTAKRNDLLVKVRDAAVAAAERDAP